MNEFISNSEHFKSILLDQFQIGVGMHHPISMGGRNNVSYDTICTSSHFSHIHFFHSTPQHEATESITEPPSSIDETKFISIENHFISFSHINHSLSQMYRGDSNSLLTLNAEDDFSCLMNDPMFQLSTNGMNGHQNNQQTATSHAYNPHMLAQMPTSVATSHSNEIPHLINSRKRKY